MFRSFGQADNTAYSQAKILQAILGCQSCGTGGEDVIHNPNPMKGPVSCVVAKAWHLLESMNLISLA